MRSPKESATGALEPLLGIQEVADLCGVSPKTIKTWLYKREGPKSLRVGKYRRFRRSDLETWWETLVERS